MTVKHTPEPWRYSREDFAVWAQSGGEECCVADLDSLPFNTVNTEEEQHANGDLIAAAPALADALEAALLFHRGGPWTPEDGQRWRLLTGSSDATTKALCDCIRARLLAAGRPE